jgi:hypothetical protein
MKSKNSSARLVAAARHVTTITKTSNQREYRKRNAAQLLRGVFLFQIVQ